MLFAWVPLAVAIVGLIVFRLTKNIDVKELARILFFVGAFFTVWGVADETIHVPGSRARVEHKG